MKILKMVLDNFKGCKHLELDLDGHDCKISGMNETGKTTIADAFCWCIFDKPYEETANFTPKSIVGKEYVHNLEHSVELTLEMDNGEIKTFKKSYHEVYKKTKGNITSEFSTHTTDCTIDKVPYKPTAYQKFWESYFDNADIPKILSMPYYFSKELHWTKRRAILIDLVGDISDADIFSTTADLRELQSKIGKKSVDDYRKILKAELSDINKRRELLPARIDEASKAMPDITGIDREAIETELARLTAELEKLQTERAVMKSGGDNSAQIREKIAQLKEELSTKRGEHLDTAYSATKKYNDEVTQKRSQISVQEGYASETAGKLKTAIDDKERIERKRKNVSDDYKALKKKVDETAETVFNESDTVCPTCGQNLPEERISELRAEFNLNKSNQLEALEKQIAELLEDGKKTASKEMLAEKESEIQSLKNSLALYKGNADRLKNELTQFESTAKDNALPTFEQTEVYKELTRKIEDIRASAVSAEPDTSEIDGKILDLQMKKDELNIKKANLVQAEQQTARISELTSEEKQLGKEYEAAQKMLSLCDKFIREKCSRLTDKIDERFTTVKFNLFKKNITNDDIEDVCEVLVPSKTGNLVPFNNGANHAGQVNAGIEIISVLADYYKVDLPLFLDNAESINKVIPTQNQQIKLYVSEDPELKIEVLL
jgi:DNA repair exonuclease SbcCD ATPase subunit